MNETAINGTSMELDDVMPIIRRMYEYNLNLERMLWPVVIWPVLVRSGIATASTELDRLDSTVFAFTLSKFHIMFCHSLDTKLYDPDYEGALEGLLTVDDLIPLIKARYCDGFDWLSSLPKTLKNTLSLIYFSQLGPILEALIDHYGSSANLFDALVKYSSDDLDGGEAASFSGVAAASNFLTISVGLFVPD
jgi:hypothetical protein